jgi:hypothetical protein
MLRVEDMACILRESRSCRVILPAAKNEGDEAMEKHPRFHVVLHGRKVGPYDRRTIVGMRIKGALASAHVLIDADGNQLTVADLIGRKPRSNDFQPNRTSAHSTVRAIYPASLGGVSGQGHGIPPFQGEVEARVQNDALRIAGRFRKGFGWKEDRVKLALKDIVHARVRGSEVELGVQLRVGEPLHVLRLELFTSDAAAELVKWLPSATPWPQGLPSAATTAPANQHLLWLVVGSATFLIGMLMAVVVARRL